jgi:hypothetical protein
MDDAVALGTALAGHDDLGAALASYRREREPSKRTFIDACDRSIRWYEQFAEKMEAHDPTSFVFDFITRTGRITERRLFEEFPRFMAANEKAWREFRSRKQGEQECL